MRSCGISFSRSPYGRFQCPALLHSYLMYHVINCICMLYLCTCTTWPTHRFSPFVLFQDQAHFGMVLSLLCYKDGERKKSMYPNPICRGRMRQGLVGVSERGEQEQQSEAEVRKSTNGMKHNLCFVLFFFSSSITVTNNCEKK